MKIEKMSIKNFKVFRDAEISDLPNMCVFLGANGAGKSTLFEVFGFLSDALKSNIKIALNKRGGFKEVYSRNGEGDISFEIKFRNTHNESESKKQPLITYSLSININAQNQPVVINETLKYRRGSHGAPYKFLEFKKGRGTAIINESELINASQEIKEEREEQVLDSPDILAIKGLGQFQKFKAISSFRKLLENWYVSNFQIQSAQSIEDIGLSEQLSVTGDNLAQVTKFIYEQHPDIFKEILDKMKKRVPGVSKVEAQETADGRIILSFSDSSFKDPFIARYVSDGTIKMFAYLVLLSDPNPRPLLCIEEPENYLHQELLRELAEEFREYADKGGQVFISTHSPDFVNALFIEEVFWIQKKDGYSKVFRAKDDKRVAAFYKMKEPLGALWRQGNFKGSGPNS